MKKSQGWIVVAAVVASCGVFQWAVAQNGGGQPAQYAGTRVAVISVGRIFQNHARFKEQMNALKQEMQAASSEIQAEKAKLMKLEEARNQFARGTPDYNNRDDQLTAEKARLAVEFKKRDEAFMRENAQIYYNVYAEIMQLTQYYCQQRGCDIAIRIDDMPFDPQRPETLQPILGKSVVWHNQALDITDYVLAEINHPAAGGNGGAATSTPASPFNAANPNTNGYPPR